MKSYLILSGVIALALISGTGLMISSRTATATSPPTPTLAGKIGGPQPFQSDQPKPPPLNSDYPKPASCPQDIGALDVVRQSVQSPVPASVALVSDEIVLRGSDGWTYAAYGGAHSPNDWATPTTNDGVLVVFRLTTDPCAKPVPQGTLISHVYHAPIQGGPVHIVGANGDVVSFQDSAGHSGSLNVLTGAFGS